MARIRTIKPEFFTSEDIVSLTPLARLLYIALWCEADRDGRLVWKPKTFKIRYLPAEDCDIQALCKEITDAGLVVLYGSGYAHIPTFHAHQHVNPRESLSQLPAPGETTGSGRAGTRQARVTVAHVPDSDAQGGREGKGKEGKDASCLHKEGSDRFEDFWVEWPKNDRKQDKATCYEWWRKKALDGAADTILADVKAKRGTAKWRDGFIEAPMVYLRNRRWEDRGLDLSGGADKLPPWCRESGFDNVHEAGNAGCYAHNAEQFRDGKRLESA